MPRASENQGRIFDTMRDFKIITHGTRSVSTKISVIVAEKERLDIEGNKVDASGL
jgi:hypothetical protein